MSFDIFFQPGRFATPIKQKDSSTGDSKEPLTPSELKAVQMVLTNANARGPDSYGCYVVEFEDGGVVELFGRDLSKGCMVSVRAITLNLFGFLIDLLKAGNWAMCPAMEDNIAITCSPECLKGIPEGFPRIVVCTTADELRVLISGGFHEWNAIETW